MQLALVYLQLFNNKFDLLLYLCPQVIASTASTNYVPGFNGINQKTVIMWCALNTNLNTDTNKIFISSEQIRNKFFQTNVPVFCFQFTNHHLHLSLLRRINTHHYLHRTFQLQQENKNLQFQFHFLDIRNITLNIIVLSTYKKIIL